MKTTPRDALNAEALFEDVQNRFSNFSTLWSSWRSRVALLGSNQRIGRRRVSTMRSSANAKFLIEALRGLSAPEVTAFQALALVNKEQAEAAFRYTVIVNFTVPITLIIVANQLLPGGLIPYLSNDSDLVFVLIATLIGAAVLLTYLLVVIAQSGVQAARDIYHLCLIEQGRRVQTTLLNDAEEMELAIDT